MFGRKSKNERLRDLECRMTETEAELRAVSEVLRATQKKVAMAEGCLGLIGEIFAAGDKRLRNVESLVELLRGILAEADAEKEGHGKKTVSEMTKKEEAAISLDAIIDEWLNGKEEKDEG